MRKAGTIEIKTYTSFLCPIDPSLKVFWLDLVAVDQFTSEFTINCMKVQSLFPRQKQHHLIEIRSHLFYSFCFSRKIPGRLNATASKNRSGFFKTANIICLPAMKTDIYFIQFGKYFVGINS